MSNIFYEGQEVGCLMFGEGVVETIYANSGRYALRVNFNGNCNAYTEDGKYLCSHIRPMLYPIAQYREIIANLPAPEAEKWQPKVGEWCLFWDDGDKASVEFKQFKCMENGKYRCNSYSWDNCAPFIGELPPHLKEVQP